MKNTVKQNMIAVSLTSKTFVQDCTADFGGPSKSKAFLAASEREVVDGMVAFVEGTRYQKRTIEKPVMIEEDDDQGGTRFVDSGEVELVEVEIDIFGEYVEGIIAGRMDSVRVNTAAAKVKEQADELARLRAELAALKGETAPE